MSMIPDKTPTPIPTPKPIPFTTELMNYLPLIIIIIICSIAVVIAILFIRKRKGKGNKEMKYKDFRIGKYNVIMYRKLGENYVEMDRVKLDMNNTEFRYHEKDFKTFNVSHIAFSDKKCNYYAFDFDSGEQLSFRKKGMPKTITVEDVDIYVNRHIIADLVAGLEDVKNNKGQWLMLIIGIVVGVAVGFIIGQQYTLSTIPKETSEPVAQAILGVFTR